jgi:hypothetical protein
MNNTEHTITNEERDRVRGIIETEILTRKNNAAWGGEMGDRVAGVIQLQLDAWLAGLKGIVPENWKDFPAWIQSDPEYPEYLRMKEKFERK